MTDIQSHYKHWLSEAVTMELKAIAMIDAMRPALLQMPYLLQMLDLHRLDTQGQLDALLELQGGGEAPVIPPSEAIQDPVRIAIASYAFENEEIATYEVLIASARQLDDQKAIAVFEAALKQEELMADWLIAHLDDILKAHVTGERMEIPA